jgi:hypothetical protein
MRCLHRHVSNSPPLVSYACWGRGDGHHRVNILSAVWGVTALSYIKESPGLTGTIPTELGNLPLLKFLYAPAPTLPVSDSETTTAWNPTTFCIPRCTTAGLTDAIWRGRYLNQLEQMSGSIPSDLGRCTALTEL